VLLLRPLLLPPWPSVLLPLLLPLLLHGMAQLLPAAIRNDFERRASPR
jgi:hypothetical protein